MFTFDNLTDCHLFFLILKLSVNSLEVLMNFNFQKNLPAAKKYELTAQLMEVISPASLRKKTLDDSLTLYLWLKLLCLVE